MKRNKKAKKWQLYTAIGVASAIVIGAAGILIFRQPSQSAVKEETSHIVTAKEGSVASSVLLSGTVTAKNEQYVYFDASKGDLDEILVSVGDKVEEGQALVPTEAGLPEQAQAATSSVSSIDSQISDAKDNRADAVAQLNKAQAQLDAATVLSTLEGTVVEVNRNVSKSPTGNSQVVVHVVSNENLHTTLLTFLLGKKLPLLRRFTKIRAGQEKSAIFLIILRTMEKQRMQLLEEILDLSTLILLM